MNRVLVTGGTGFIGRHILPLLTANGAEVHAVCLSSVPAAGNNNVHWHRVDLLDSSQMRNLVRLTLADQLIHMAWYTTPPRYWEASENTLWLRASIELFQEFAAIGGRRIVAAGTCAEYAWNSGYCDEDSTPLESTSLYGKSKKALQAALAELAASNGISAAWARLFFPYGPGEHSSKLVTHIATALLNGEVAYCSTPAQKRDFIYASDVASAIIAVLRSSFAGAINIGTGVPVEVREVAEKVANRVGRLDLLRFNAADSSSSAPTLVAANVEKLRDLICWTPAYSLDEGIAETVAWCANHR